MADYVMTSAEARELVRLRLRCAAAFVDWCESHPSPPVISRQGWLDRFRGVERTTMNPLAAIANRFSDEERADWLAGWDAADAVIGPPEEST